MRPVIQVGLLTSVPVFAELEESAVVVPLPSSNFHQPTKPVCACTVLQMRQATASNAPKHVARRNADLGLTTFSSCSVACRLVARRNPWAHRLLVAAHRAAADQLREVAVEGEVTLTATGQPVARLEGIAENDVRAG